MHLVSLLLLPLLALAWENPRPNPTCTEFFFLRNRATGKCLDVSGTPGTGSGANVQSWSCEFGNPQSDQIWYLEDSGNLKSRPSAKCLDVSGYRSLHDGANVQIYACEDPDWDRTDQTWYFHYHPGTHYFQIKNRNTGKCVDISGHSSTRNGANAQSWTCEPYDQHLTDQWWEKVPILY